MKKYRLTVENRNTRRFELAEFITADDMLELSNDLYMEGLHSDAQWWLARWHGHPNGYWDTIETGECPFYCWHDACFNLRDKLTVEQATIANGTSKGSFVLEIAA